MSPISIISFDYERYIQRPPEAQTDSGFWNWFHKTGNIDVVSNKAHKIVFFQNIPVMNLVLQSAYEDNAVYSDDYAFVFFDPFRAKLFVNNVTAFNNKSKLNKELGHIKQLFEDAVSKRKIIWVRYSKKNGWVNWESFVKGKQRMSEYADSVIAEFNKKQNDSSSNKDGSDQ